MPTDININDNAKTVIDRINDAINEQGAGVAKPDYTSNAPVVVDCVNKAIAAESKPSLERVAVNDNAPTFIGKINDLFKSIREGGTTPHPSGNFTWAGKNYIAFGDSITDPTIKFSNNVEISSEDKYCKKVADLLGMSTFTNAGVSGSTMANTGNYTYPVTESKIGTPLRSFVYELLFGGDNVADDSVRPLMRGPYSVTNWEQYDLITIMLGVNDRTSINVKIESYGTLSDKVWDENWTADGLDLTTFYGAYEASIGTLKQLVRSDCVIVLCAPPNVHVIQEPWITHTELAGIKAAVEAVANKYGCYFVDFYGLSGIDDTSTPEYMYDGLHINEAGHTILANLLYNKLVEIAEELDDSTEPQPDEYGNAPNILVLGNSYTLDSWSYVPYLLKEKGINIKLGLCYINAAGLATYSGSYYKYGVNAARSFYYIDTSVADAEWTTVQDKSTDTYEGETRYLPTGETCVQYNGGNWDIIVLQQTSTASFTRNSYNTFSSVKTSIVNTMSVLGKTLNEDYVLGFNINHPNGGINNRPTDILLNISELCQTDSDIKAVFPYGTGIVNGRNYQELHDIEYTDKNGNTFNDMTIDGAHLVGGLPHYLASITIIESLFRRNYSGLGLSVTDSSVIPNIDNKWVSDRTFPYYSRAATSRGLTAGNISLARTAAMHAIDEPFSIWCDSTTMYDAWPFMVIIRTNDKCEISDNGGYAIVKSGTTAGVTESYFFIPPDTELSGIIITAKDGCFIDSYSWIDPRLDSYSEIHRNFGTLTGSTVFEINGITVNTNVRITVNGKTQTT